MSIEQMRAILKKFYGETWQRKVDRMSDNQAAAVYMRWLNAGKLKGIN